MDPARLLPHGPPARMITRVLESDRHSARALGRIRTGAPGAGSGGAPAVLGLELGAQCAAMIGAAATREQSAGDPADSEPPRIGYLVSIRAASLERAFLPVELELEVEARRIGGVAGLELFEVAVRVPGEAEPAVRGTLGTMLTERRVAAPPSPGEAAG